MLASSSENPVALGRGDLVERLLRHQCRKGYWRDTVAEYRFISEVLIPTPMRSLRDVDEAVSIELDAMGSAWASQ